MAWTQPRTDWTSESWFNISDYNRIKNNLAYLAEKGNEIVKPFDTIDMGSDVTSYSSVWTATQFNNIENNLTTIAKNTYGIDYGTQKTFYSNGIFIDYAELNRIESACLDIYTMLCNQEVAMRRLSFRMGTFKEAIQV